MAKKIKRKDYSAMDNALKSLTGDIKIAYKKVEYIRLSGGLRYATNMEGFPQSHTFALIGPSDTGKSTTMAEFIKFGLDSDILPVYIDKEGKFNTMRAMDMGIPIEPYKVNITDGEIIEFDDPDFDNAIGEEWAIQTRQPFIVADDIYISKFLEENKKLLKGPKKTKVYTDISSRVTVKDVLNFMKLLADKLIKQKKSDPDFPYKGVLFLIDSYDRLHTDGYFDAIDADKQTRNDMDVQMKNTAMADFVETYVKGSRNAEYPITVTMGFVVNKYTYQANPAAQATAKASGGDKRKHYTDLQLYFGTKTGVTMKKSEATVKGVKGQAFNTVEVEVEKNHGANPITKKPTFITAHKSTMTITKHGIIPDTEEARKQYKKDHPEIFGKIDIDSVYGEMKEGSDE